MTGSFTLKSTVVVHTTKFPVATVSVQSIIVGVEVSVIVNVVSSITAFT